jgi:hypothetical protein
VGTHRAAAAVPQLGIKGRSRLAEALLSWRG